MRFGKNFHGSKFRRFGTHTLLEAATTSDYGARCHLGVSPVFFLKPSPARLARHFTHTSTTKMFAVRSTSAVAANAAAIRRVGAKKFNPLAAHVARKAPVAKARFSVQANSSSPSPDGEVDLYRDTPLRYMGYSNEVGEAFEAFLPSWGVAATYGVASASPRARAPSVPPQPRSATRTRDSIKLG